MLWQPGYTNLHLAFRQLVLGEERRQLDGQRLGLRVPREGVDHPEKLDHLLLLRQHARHLVRHQAPVRVARQEVGPMPLLGPDHADVFDGQFPDAAPVVISDRWLRQAQRVERDRALQVQNRCWSGKSEKDGATRRPPTFWPRFLEA